MAKKQVSKGPAIQKIDTPDPFSPQNIKQLAVRLGLPLVAVWVIGGCIAGVTQSSTAFWVALGIPAVITLGIAGLVLWVVSQARKAKGVAGILQGVETAEDRKAAMEKLDAGFKKNDPAAVFAKAQLYLQEGDTKKALETLEQIDLSRVMAPIADEARAQRAMIHLLTGDVTPARDLVDAIDLSRQQDPKARAMMGSVVAEAWARTGQAKKAADTIGLFNPEEPALEQVAPQIHRARAFVYAATGDVKAMRRAMKKLLDQDARLLGSFLGKRTHPLLQKVAKQMLQSSGQVPRKMQIQRH